MSTAVERVREAARSLGLTLDVRTFPEGTRTAEDAARAVGCDVAQIVKSLVWFADEEPVIAYVSGRHRLDPALLARAAGAATARPATAEEAREVTGFAVGGTPPFGHRRRLRAFLDETLLAFEVVWAAAGTPTTVFPLVPGSLVERAGAAVARLGPSGRTGPRGV